MDRKLCKYTHIASYIQTHTYIIQHNFKNLFAGQKGDPGPPGPPGHDGTKNV